MVPRPLLPVRALSWRVASALQNDPNAPPAVLAALLTEPASKAGVGAVALALRIR